MSTPELYKKHISEDLMVKVLQIVAKQHKIQHEAPLINGKKSIFAGAAPKKVAINLDIVAFKIPVPKNKIKNRPLHPQTKRIVLDHTLTDASSGVLLVTKDHPKIGANPTISNAHYQKVLAGADCNHLVSEIMSLSQFKAEHSEREAREELNNRIDMVLCDKSVVKVVPRILGRQFHLIRKFPMGVRMAGRNLKGEIDKALRSTGHLWTFRNTQSSLTFGHTEMTIEQLTDNLRCVLKYLCSTWSPGYWPNVKTLYVTSGLKTRVPLYISTNSGCEVPRLVIDNNNCEIMEGDFGFGKVKYRSDGTILEHKKVTNWVGKKSAKKSKIMKTSCKSVEASNVSVCETPSGEKEANNKKGRKRSFPEATSNEDAPVMKKRAETQPVYRTPSSESKDGDKVPKKRRAGKVRTEEMTVADLSKKIRALSEEGQKLKAKVSEKKKKTGRLNRMKNARDSLNNARTIK